MVNSQTFNWNIFVLEEGVVESRVQSRKQPILAAERITGFNSRSLAPCGQFKLHDSL
ncbi:hypothetical protein QUB70_25585 [Microcoleus sp. A003_D6]